MNGPEDSDKNPEAAFVLLEMAQDMWAEKLVEGHDRETFGRWANRLLRSRERFRQRPAIFAIMLRLGRLINDSRFPKILADFLISDQRRPDQDPAIVMNLPLISIPDIRWLSQITGNPDLISSLRNVFEAEKVQGK